MNPIFRRYPVVALSLLTLIGPSMTARADRSFGKPVAKGVRLKQTVQEAPNAPRIVTVVEVDLKQPGVSVGADLGLDYVETEGGTGGREAVSTLARRKGATVAVNGDFFIGGSPVGLLIRNGELVTLPYMNRVVCALLPGNQVIFDIPQAGGTVRVSRSISSPDEPPAAAPYPLAGINRKRGPNALMLYTPTYGPKTLTNNFGTEVVLSGVRLPLKPGRSSGTVEEVRAGQGGTPLRKGTVVLSGHGPGAEFLKKLQPGDALEVSLSVRSPQIPDWSVVREAIGGGPYLVRGGRVAIDAKEQRFQPDVVLGRAPRTAVGRTRDGRLLMVTVDGRQPMSAGMTLSELADLMLRLGCETAINLDGGGSTAMAVQGMRVNSPSDGWERSVAAMLVVRAPALSRAELNVSGADSDRSTSTSTASQAVTDPAPFFLMAEMDGAISSGQTLAFELRDDNGGPLDPNLPILWGVEGPIGFVDQSGTFTAGKAGSGKVLAKWGTQSAAVEVRVVPSRTPAQILAVWSPPDPSRPFASVLTVTATDASGNRIPGLPVNLTLPEGASADALSRPTDEKGIALFQIAWTGRPEGMEYSPRQVTVKTGTLSVLSPKAPIPIPAAPSLPPPLPPSSRL
ncbi:MAG: phosphodiester glycosidase family protein [Armatimonadetes bacterium]|nr:phosphodiester glycosidase family protein [Armatimonadota bacterium]